MACPLMACQSLLSKPGRWFASRKSLTCQTRERWSPIIAATRLRRRRPNLSSLVSMSSRTRVTARLLISLAKAARALCLRAIPSIRRRQSSTTKRCTRRLERSFQSTYCPSCITALTLSWSFWGSRRMISSWLKSKSFNRSLLIKLQTSLLRFSIPWSMRRWKDSLSEHKHLSLKEATGTKKSLYIQPISSAKFKLLLTIARKSSLQR